MNGARRTIACLALGLATAPSPLLAQADVVPPHVAQPERPSVATHAHTVAVGYIEVETGVQSYHPQTGETEYDTPSLIKIGLTRGLQFDLYEGVSALSHTGYGTFGLGDVSTGLKWRFVDGAPVVGDFAVQSTVKFATGSVEKGTGTGTTDLNVIVISSREVRGASLDVNVGFTARTGDGSVVPTRATVWTMSWGLPVRGAIGWAAEIFGYPGTRGASGRAPIVAVLTGPTWVLRPYLVFDAGVIVAIAGPQATTVYAGLTWNVGRIWGPRAFTPPATSAGLRPGR